MSNGTLLGMCIFNLTLIVPYLLCSFCRTILSSAGNDGRVRLWKVGTDGEWKSAGSISVEQAEQESKADQRNVGTV